MQIARYMAQAMAQVHHPLAGLNALENTYEKETTGQMSKAQFRPDTVMRLIAIRNCMIDFDKNMIFEL